jgi:hypothetical protein
LVCILDIISAFQIVSTKVGQAQCGTALVVKTGADLVAAGINPSKENKTELKEDVTESVVGKVVGGVVDAIKGVSKGLAEAVGELAGNLATSGPAPTQSRSRTDNPQGSVYPSMTSEEAYRNPPVIMTTPDRE